MKHIKFTDKLKKCSIEAAPGRDWLNPYMLKLADYEQLLLGSSAPELSPTHKVILAERVAEASKVYVELGSGSGAHLIARAKLNPQDLFIGFELRYKRLVKSAEKAKKNQLNNVLLLRTSGSLLEELFPPRSIDGVFINFPDPWPKRRWSKHRLINTSLIETLSRLLKSGAFLSYKTDQGPYFRDTLALISNSPNFKVEKCTFDYHSSQYADHALMSEFESLFYYKKIAVCYLEASRA